MRRRFALLFLLTFTFAVLARPALANYTDPAYVQSDIANMARASGRHSEEFLTPSYTGQFPHAAASTWMDAQARQMGDLPAGRVYGGAGQLLPGGSVGDPRQDREGSRLPVAFLARTGAKLRGHLWVPSGEGRHPGVVITTGSIQGHERMYWWAARALAQAGFLVLTWDVQGQGQSETVGHAPGDPLPTLDGVPSQQERNFVEGTIDALRFFLSTPGRPYVPAGWSATDVAVARGESGLDWYNPLHALLDRSRLGLAGHSLGARAVSVVQQCTTDPWPCGGERFPSVRAIVAWDRLSADVVPRVPAMDQQADGYFFAPTPAPAAPDPDAHLDALQRWQAAGLAVWSATIRGGTHLEWTDVPYILPATAYGRDFARYYTVAWFEWLVEGDRAARARLLQGPTTSGPQHCEHLSTRYRSALDLGRGVWIPDLRASACGT